jgi:hypothetical protein
METTMYDWITVPPHTRIAYPSGVQSKWCDGCKNYIAWSKYPKRPEVPMGIDAECAPCQRKSARLPEPVYGVPLGFFSGFDPDSAEWACQGELDAYPGVVKKACTSCDELKETYREFNTEKLGKNGRKARCAECEKERVADIRKRKRA